LPARHAGKNREMKREGKGGEGERGRSSGYQRAFLFYCFANTS
jgi:hypothetical protein